QQDPRAALRAFARQLAEEHPDNPGVRLFLGLTLAQVGDLDGASREYKESARLAPDDPFPHYFHGQALHTLDRLDMAIREYREAVTLAPQDVPMRPELAAAHAKLGWRYYNKNRVAQALEHFEKASRHDPDDAQTLHGLGLAKLAAGKKDEGILSLKQAYQKEEREDKKRLIRSVLVKVGALSH